MKAGLRAKLLVPTIGAVVICMTLASLYSAKKASDELWAELLNSSRHLAQGLAKSLTMFAEDLQGAVVMQAKNDKLRLVYEEKTPETLKAAAAALTDLARFDPSIQAATLLTAKGDVLASSDPGSTGNFSDREYFKKAMNGQTNISEPFLSRVTNKPVFAVATPVAAGGKTAGILYLRVDLGKFSEDMVDPVKVGQHGYAYVADKSGLVFSHPDKDNILKTKISDYDWGKTMLSGQSGVVSYAFEGREMAAIHAKDKLNGWTVAVTVNKSDIASSSASVRNASLMVGAGGIALVCAVIVLALGSMLKYLNRCVAYAETVAGGCLECGLLEKRDDELGTLSRSLGAMVESLKKMIATAEGKTAEAERQTELARQAVAEAEEAKAKAELARAEGMLQAAGRLGGVVEVVTGASDELNARIEESNRGAETQSRRMAETATAMEQMNATVLEVAKNAANASQTTGQAMTKAKEGAGVVGRVVSSIEEVRGQAGNLKRDMGTLGQRAQDIGRILNVISDIADQTNLLALNAAIEAARAGDAGRGFAVVADEVRKLAEKTMAATREVGEAITGIQDGAKLNVDNVDRAAAAINEATGLATTSGAALDEIVRLVENASDQVRSIATAAEEQSASSEQINRSIEEVNAISESTARAMNEAASSVAELARQAHALNSLMEALEQEGRGG
jgi:methyl-accepting chemotaxis protein